MNHAPPPNVLLVLLDATRTDACSCYGCQRPTTPTLDRLASEGVLYEQAISPAPWTLPALASIFTGLYPGQIDIYTHLKLATALPTLAQLLAGRGYATFGVTNNSWLSADFGLQRGFDTLHKQWQCWQTEREANTLTLTQRPQKSSWTGTVMRELGRGNPLKNAVNLAFANLVAYRRDLGAWRIHRPLTRWIASRSGPWFAFAHFMEAHLPNRPPPAWRARFAADAERAAQWARADQWRAVWGHITGATPLSEADLAAWRDLYLAEVAYADHHLGLLIDWLRHTGRLDDTLVIVFADHGENLGEHGLLNHQYCVYDTLLRVPLVMRYPARLPAGGRISHQVQTLDIFPTILEAAGVAAPPRAGQSLLAADGQRPFTVAEYTLPRLPHPRTLARFGLQREQLKRFERGLTAIRTASHKLILGADGAVELYAWPDDPAETRDLAAQQPGLARDLRQQLERWQQAHGPLERAATPAKQPIDPNIEARLRGLGYLE